ncbi:Ubiquitin carboxyl-terminal hydrolase 3 [Candida viswanathii]|uniref:Ubiquitin carboxyl-terminal hydrolase n=1 Tax=Candida viswanathii TaxID=5486 RepID=A0A367XV72_9ASCO|nr:Ubiquitin carboxyl-terminal hydrolase 3 [Candida viswanathii]
MSSSSSSNSGSLRFRLDAASFSPSQYPHYAIPQQFATNPYMHQPIPPQQPVYFQYPTYQVMINPMYAAGYQQSYVPEQWITSQQQQQQALFMATQQQQQQQFPQPPYTPSSYVPPSKSYKSNRAPKVVDHPPPKEPKKKEEAPVVDIPLFVNTTRNEYLQNHSLTQESRSIEDLQRGNMLEECITSNDRVIINTNFMKIIDANDNKTIITNGQPEPPQNTASASTTSVVEQPPQASSTSPATSTSSPVPARNWASFLQATAPPPPPTPKKTVKPKQATLTPTQPTPASRSVTPVTPFNINNESAQPLGILLLRIMFDNNYSVFNSLARFDVKPRGLTNSGNICYMNSILQILLYCEPFNRLLKLIETKSIGTLGVSPTPLLDATITFFNQFQEDSKAPVSPEDFYSSLTQQEKFAHLKWGQQEDAEEFLGYYIDGLNDEMLREIKLVSTSQVDKLIQTYSQEHDSETASRFKFNVKSTIKRVKNEEEEDDGEWSQVNNKKNSTTNKVEVDPTPLKMIFGGQFKSVLTIPKQSSSFQKSITLDPFQHVQLDISAADTIDDAFKHLNELENISYTNNNKEVQAKKQTFIEKLPNVLIIHLKRFSYLKDQEIGVEKLRKKIDYNHDLTIPKEVLASEPSSPIKYQLLAVVYHHGSSADAGHYTSDIHNAGVWWRIDDTFVKQIKNEEVLNAGTEENIKNAYILLYTRI